MLSLEHFPARFRNYSECVPGCAHGFRFTLWVTPDSTHATPDRLDLVHCVRYKDSLALWQVRRSLSLRSADTAYDGPGSQYAIPAMNDKATIE